MNLKLGIVFLFLCCITAIKCWVELDIAGNDLSQPNPQFVQPKDDCDEQGVGGGGGRYPQVGRPGRGGRPGMGKRRKRPNQARRQAFRDVNNFARNFPSKKDTDRHNPRGPGAPKQRSMDGDQQNDDEDCVATSTEIIETPQKPRLRMIKTKKEAGKEKVERQTMEPTECTEIIDMEPKTSIKIETYTIPYTQNVVKYKTVTRRVVYIQRRRKIKRTLNKPVLVIKRKVVKDRQFFERIIPKVIETREIINKPKVEYKVIEGPMEEMGGPKPLDKEEDCDDSDSLPPPPEQMNQMPAYNPNQGMPRQGMFNPNDPDCPDPQQPMMSYPQQPMVADPGANGIQVGFDFASALHSGLNAAFGNANQQYDGVVQPGNMRSAMIETTPCPPGMVDNGLGPNLGGGYPMDPYQGGGAQGGYAVVGADQQNTQSFQ